MSRSQYTDALCVLLIALMLLTLLLFRWGEALGIEKVERESALSAASAKAVIALSDDYIKVKGSGAYAAGGVVTIAYGGEYTFTGSLSEGQIVVQCDKRAQVKLIFDNASIHCSTGPALWVKNAGRTTLSTASGSVNSLSCGSEFRSENVEAGANAVIYSQDDLVLQGKGAMTVSAPGQHGINAKDELKLRGGEWTVEAGGDGIRGKDGIVAEDGAYTVRCGGDGLQSYNDVDEGRGSIEIGGGSFFLTAGQDGIQALRDLTITGGNMDVTTGGGAPETMTAVRDWIDRDGQTNEEESKSAKGLKCGGILTISGGSFSLNCSDDALHSDNDALITGGSFTVLSGDDALHANNTIAFDGANFTAVRCMEGIEAQKVEIRGGSVDVTSLNDGINANGLSRGVNMSQLIIAGGTVHLCTQADGLDSNGDILIAGGTVAISSEPGDGNSAVDYGIENGGDCLIQGGSIVACGFAGMAETFSANSTQCSLLYIFEETRPGGTEVTLTDKTGRVLLRHVPENAYDCVIFSCGEMALGGEYTVCAGDEEGSVTLTETAQRVGSAFGDRPSMPGYRPGKPGEQGFSGSQERGDVPKGSFGGAPQGGFGPAPASPSSQSE
ncbi:MAG: carbohydrate-binding domain-containing protein [Oscillospiraceae bacterium]|nr:carbohydrate-binding domain-containing protein [Oscillospiraceae bacterium]